MLRRRWRVGGIFWRLFASYFTATLVTAFIAVYVGRFEGPFDALRENPIVVFFRHAGNEAGNSGILFVLLASVVGLLTGLLVSGNLTRRLYQVMRAADAWSRGEFAARAQVASHDELGELASELNAMAGQIQAMFTTRESLAIVEERNRLARDLHDTVKQQVFAGALLVRAARKQLTQAPEVALRHLEAAEALTEQTQRELISLIQALRPSALADKGLAETLRAYSDDWSRQVGIAVDVRLQGERETPLLVEDTLFRVTQEALANIARHSGARTAHIALTWEDEHVRLAVRDDGNGFDTTRNTTKGMGLTSMRERVEAAHGEFRVSSSPAGTTVEACAPLASVATTLLTEARDG